jgi:hypothetical protein
MRPLLLPFVMMLAAPSLGAQRRTPALPEFRPTALQSSRGAVPAGTPALFPPAPDHRWEGFGIGAGITGILGAGLVYAFCTDSDSGSHGSCVFPVLEGAVGGAVIGGVIGGFIGATIPKAPADSTAQP